METLIGASILLVLIVVYIVQQDNKEVIIPKELTPFKTKLAAHPCYDRVPTCDRKIDNRCGDASTYQLWLIHVINSHFNRTAVEK
jgi:hypothetical protein